MDTGADAHDDAPREEHRESPQDGGAPAPASGLPSLPLRLVQVVVSPGKLMDALAAEPRWVGALLVVVALSTLSAALLPPELIIETQRQVVLERGGDFPEMSERALQIIRISTIVAPLILTTIITFVIAGLYTLVFAFILGDEGRYKQYLAALCHAWFIAALAGVVLAPLRISTENLQLTVNAAGFLFFLSDGYLLNVFRALDLTVIWSTLVFAQGARSIDPRRSFGSAAVVGLSLVLVIALIQARFM